MSEKILVPVLGESITEATVSKWLKIEGDKVKVDEPIVELETDKVNLEVPSPVSGVLIATAEIAQVSSMQIVKRNLIPMLVGLIVMIVYHFI